MRIQCFKADLWSFLKFAILLSPRFCWPELYTIFKIGLHTYEVLFCVYEDFLWGLSHSSKQRFSLTVEFRQAIMSYYFWNTSCPQKPVLWGLACESLHRTISCEETHTLQRNICTNTSLMRTCLWGLTQDNLLLWGLTHFREKYTYKYESYEDLLVRTYTGQSLVVRTHTLLLWGNVDFLLHNVNMKHVCLHNILGRTSE